MINNIFGILPFDGKRRGPLTILCDSALHDKPKDVPDDDFLLSAYEKWGEDFPRYISGDFAAAIWDESSKKLTLARDVFGIRPLCYFYDGKNFAFASTALMLFKSGALPMALNEERIADFLAIRFDDKTLTPYKNVFNVLPAHTLTFHNGRIAHRRYWSFDPKKTVKLSSDAEYAEAFRSLFLEAVKNRLPETGPAACTLSGGLDSSSVACAARRFGPVHSFSLVFDSTPVCDERAFINPVLAQGGIASHFVSTDNISIWGRFDSFVSEKSDPWLHSSYYLIDELVKSVADKGFPVLLDGYDGDDVVGHGTSILREYFLTLQWPKLWRELKTWRLNNDVRKINWRLAADSVFGPLIALPLRPFKRMSLNFDSFRRRYYPQINEGFAKKVRLGERLAKPLEHENTSYYLLPKHEQLGMIRSSSLLQHIELMDFFGRRHGVEIRHPFWDKKLVEFCLSIPTSLKMRDGWSRYILRIAMEGILPKEVQWRRTKTYLTKHVENGLFNKQILRERFEDLSPLTKKYIDEEYLRQMQDNAMNNRLHYATSSLLWRVLVLDSWLRRFSAGKKLSIEPAPAVSR